MTDKAKVDELFNTIYSEYYHLIFKYCLSRLKCNKDYADDCVQDTFMTLYNKMIEGEIINSPRAFLYNVATNYIKKYYNRIKSENENLTDFEYAQNVLYSDEDIVEKINFNEFEFKLNTILTKEEKELYTLRFSEEQRVKDIALRFNISEKYCSLKITRLKRKIISSLKDYY